MTLSPVIAQDVAEIIDRPLPWERLNGTTVLVTGANGMLPSYAVHTLLGLNDARDASITVVGLVRNENKARRILGPVLDRPDFRLLATDVTQLHEFDGPLDLVIHGASAARPALHASDPVATIKANLLGSFNLLDLCVAKGAGRFVLMSSSEVYGAQPEDVRLIPESSYGGFDFLNPRASYSEGKRAAETIASVYAAQHDLDARIVRFGHIYGPGMALDDGRVQADFAANVVRGENIVLNSDGAAMRTYTYVGDAVAGMFYALLAGTDRAYNVADPGGMVSIRDLALKFAQARPEKQLERIFANPDHADDRAYNQSKYLGLDSSAVEALGWSAQVDLEHGIDRMLRSYEETPAG
ncbi:NAD-dependent epimerase/dehydratase family protein [Tessaracoccus caeni]|uniref:NAD-dependent epimerase/dehydratase family protein n=1 Tax=Tessaracoccus caeni TaxID=3031239 RepID=UPI0023DA867A|nr:NAD-dependent epimerase/dehydratase family protein [Tessaracoccus caeni]MDF1489939.1 NAD-dependent epimerase/dehydratase family protein [Tessaracoccus caeni]